MPERPECAGSKLSAEEARLGITEMVVRSLPVNEFLAFAQKYQKTRLDIDPRAERVTAVDAPAGSDFERIITAPPDMIKFTKPEAKIEPRGVRNPYTGEFVLSGVDRDTVLGPYK